MYGKRILKGVGIAGIFVGAFLFFLAAPKSKAQTDPNPSILITWQASNSYAPASYAAKILPTTGSAITASLEVISPTGQPVDLSDQTIYWYLDDTFLGGDVGAQKIVFHPDNPAPASMVLQVQVPDYPGGLLISEIMIPVVQPKVVIDAPYPQGDFSGTQATVLALPYFFNASSVAPFSFAWSVNGQTVSNTLNPQSLQISVPQSTPSGYQLSIALTTTNALDASTAQSAANLTHQSQP